MEKLEDLDSQKVLSLQFKCDYIKLSLPQAAQVGMRYQLRDTAIERKRAQSPAHSRGSNQGPLPTHCPLSCHRCPYKYKS